MRASGLVPCLIVTALALSACGTAPLAAKSRIASSVAVRALTGYAHVLAPKDVPADLVKLALAPAQAAADEASKRRGIDYFGLATNPVGMQIGDGASAADVLSFIGTSKKDADLNIELRAFVGGGQVGTSLNYSGQTTQSRMTIGLPAPAVARATDSTTFELLTGLPGNGVADAYGDLLDHLGPTLVQRFGAQPSFKWDDAPLVFAVHQGGNVTGFVFTDQGNQLVLGDRKYADVQSVACFTPDANLAAAYTIVGFNRKTSSVGGTPTWHIDKDARLGTIARCGTY
jgi:hypothetical protein